MMMMMIHDVNWMISILLDEATAIDRAVALLLGVGEEPLSQ